ncbi:MAG TPA: ATP-binding protein [Ktedonobacteraceae bacterium]|nr:ATP-binding protein [Ktedonobacteraceae bacterium]
MQPEPSARLEHILELMPVGVASLNCTDMRLLYVNSFFVSLLPQSWQTQNVVGHLLEEVLPGELLRVVQPEVRAVCSTGQKAVLSEVPYEGFLEERGRTYWHISIELFTPDVPAGTQPQSENYNAEPTLLITIEDITGHVRSRLHLAAIHHISSAIAGRFALPVVLDRILEAVQSLAGSTRCAVILRDYSISNGEYLLFGFEERTLMGAEIDQPPETVPTVTVAAQKGLHLSAQDWHPQVSEQLLLGRVMRSRSSLIISDTSTVPEIEFPLLDDNGVPRRPGSVLCVPIFEPTPGPSIGDLSASRGTTILDKQKGDVLGTIEVYHRRTRGLPKEEVELLEQFAQQAGLAIQNARLFLRIDHLARTARRHAHQQENVMQAIPDGVIIYDARWRVVDFNNAIRNLLGWTNDVIGLHISEALAHSTALYPPDAPSFEQMAAELERFPHEKRIDEFKLQGADGQYYTIRRSKAPIQDELGNIFAFVVVYHDVTEQAAARERIESEVIARTAELAQRNQALQEAQEALELESARLELLLGRLPSGVLLISANDNRIILSNHQATELLYRMGCIPSNASSLFPQDIDVAVKQTIGMNIDELLRGVLVYRASGSLMPYEEQPLFLALNKGEASEAELHLTASDGQTLYLLAKAAPLRANDGTITNAVLVWQDITRLKALERVREDFFTTMAHELKTPLANIRAHISALQANDLQWSHEQQLDFLKTADEQVNRLVEMINNFLDASRVEAGALRLEREPILLPEMVEDLQDRLEALISSSQRQLEISVPVDLPAVSADYELIMSVLTNLLSNAFRYAPEGDIVRLQAEAVYDEQDDQPLGVEIRVIDRGPGITEERQAELFTRFSTFANLRRPAPDRPGQPMVAKRPATARWSAATGLGLYISRGIIEAHGSTLRLQSSPGQGAIFAFTLPLAGPLRKED